MPAGRRGAAGIGKGSKVFHRAESGQPPKQKTIKKRLGRDRPLVARTDPRVNEIHPNYTLSEKEAVTRAVPLQNDTLVPYLPLKDAFNT